MPDQPTDRDAGPAKHKKRWLRWLRACFGVVILIVLCVIVPVRDIWLAVTQTYWPFVLAAACTTMLMQWAVADRLRRLCEAHGHHWSTTDIFQINLSTRFYGFLPGGNFTGIAIRFYRLTGDHKHYLGTAVALFYDRVVATVTMCAVGAVFWLIERPSGSWQAMAAIVIAMLVMGLALVVLFGQRPGPVVIRIRQMVSGFMGVRLRTLRDAVRESRTLTTRQVVTVYGLSVIAHLMGVVGYYLLSESLGLGLSFTTLGWVRTAMILATMIPVSVLGLGLREGAALMLLTAYPGVADSDAMAFAFMVFIVTTLLGGLVGGLIEARRMISAHPR